MGAVLGVTGMEEVGRREGWYCRLGQASFKDGREC